MSEYYSRDDLITILKSHLLQEDADKVDWNKVIADGEIYPNTIEGVDNCYIYEVPTGDLSVTMFVHPLICQEVYFDGWTGKEVYMGREEGEIW